MYTEAGGHSNSNSNNNKQQAEPEAEKEAEAEAENWGKSIWIKKKHCLQVYRLEELLYFLGKLAPQRGAN